MVLKEIEEDAVKVGIDPNKYCFDIANVELLKKQENETTAKKSSPPEKKETKKKEQPQVDSKPKYHRPAGTPTSYKSMTDEEIRASQLKLAECPIVKVKRK